MRDVRCVMGVRGVRGVRGVSGLWTYRHETYTGVCRLYVRFVQKKQTYNLQKPVILVLSSLGVMSICEVLSRLKSLKDPNLDNLYNFFSNAKNGDINAIQTEIGVFIGV